MANPPPSHDQAPDPAPVPPAGPAAPVAPAQIGWSARLLMAAAALQLAVTVLSLINISSVAFRTRLRGELAALGIDENVEGLVDGSIMFAMVTAVAAGILSVLMYALIARFITKGALWARLLGGILAIVSMYQASTVELPGGLVALAQVLLGLAAIALCYIKPGSTYFRGMQVHKLLLKRK